jgi:molecular chaperone DnaJ
MAPQREWFEKDYYAVLGVPEDASSKDIARAYKKLAKQYHPDATSGDPTAEEKFKEASAAYEVLSHAEQRKEYDQVRQMVKQGVAGPGAGRPGFGPGFDGVHFEFADGDLGDLGDLFGSLFTSRGRGRRPRMGVHGRDVEAELTISFDEAIAGVTKTVRYTTDPRAGAREVKVRIPAGIENGKRLRVAGKGEPGSGGGQPGDLFVTVHVLPHPLFGRDGKNLTLRLPVTFAEAALGAEVKVPTLDGEVTMRVPAGTPNGKTLRVRGRGIANGSGPPGDLLVTLDVQVPPTLTAEQRAAVEQLARVLDDDPRAALGRQRRGSRRAG